MKKIYLEGNEKDIEEILEIAKSKLGEGINVIDIFPQLKEE